MPIADDVETVVVVEGESDRAAVFALARKYDRDLVAEGVAVAVLGGATNVEARVRELGRSSPGLVIVGLCDVNERRFFERVLDSTNIFVCDADLEDELVRAVGMEEIEQFIDSQDEMKTFRTYQKQPVQRDWSLSDQVHRFCGTRAGRKVRYAGALVDWLSEDRVPEPLAALLDTV